MMSLSTPTRGSGDHLWIVTIGVRGTVNGFWNSIRGAFWESRACDLAGGTR